MADDQDETGGMASVKPDYFSGETAGGGGFLPPLAITVDLPDFRYTKLSKIVTEHVRFSVQFGGVGSQQVLRVHRLALHFKKMGVFERWGVDQRSVAAFVVYVGPCKP